MRDNFGNFPKLLCGIVAIVLLAAAALFVTPVDNVESAAPTQVAGRTEEASEIKEDAFVVSLNETRNGLGLDALVVDDELTRLSRVWAVEMAHEGAIFHAKPMSANVTSDWLKLGENVGVGPKVDALMVAFTNSPTHYENMIDPEFTHVGVGVTWEGDLMYTTHRFMKVADFSLSALPKTPIELHRTGN